MSITKYVLQLGIAISLLLFAFSACQADADLAEEEKKSYAVLTNLLHLENTDTLPFPALKNFDDLAPLFHQKNDTTYVINFWATWCAPCIHEFPYFERLAKEMEGDAIEIVMVSIDFDKQIRTKLPKFIKEHDVQLPVISLDAPNPHIWLELVDPQWEGSIPITVIYRNDQRRFISGEFPSYEELRKTVEEISTSN